MECINEKDKTGLGKRILQALAIGLTVGCAALVRQWLYTLTAPQDNFARLIIDLACIAAICAELWLYTAREFTRYRYLLTDSALILSAMRGGREVKHYEIAKTGITGICHPEAAPQKRIIMCCGKGTRTAVYCNNTAYIIIPSQEMLAALSAIAESNTSASV